MKAAVLAIISALMLNGAASAQSTAFTYQGRLKNGAALANGLHDFRFRLFDAAAGGAQVGSLECVDNLSVMEGVFTATIDFGQQFDTPAQRFLEIEVRADTGLGCGTGAGFVVLGPRQLIAPAPLANHARSAFSLDAPDGSPANAVFVDNNGNVGIGTTAPTHTVHVASPGPTIALQDIDSTTQQVGYVSYRDSGNVERAWVGYGTAGSPDFSIVNARPGGDIFLTPLSAGNVVLVDNGGNVGMGTSGPGAKLDVRGDIKLGPTGQLFAPGGEERLRIVRGIVLANGTIQNGAGFTVVQSGAGDLRLLRGRIAENGNRLEGFGFTSARLSTGVYRITFDTPFASTPSVTATCFQSFVGENGIANIGAVNNASVTIRVQNRLGAVLDADWLFIGIGVR